MDKVIIDGVDVSECEYYDDGICCNQDVMSLSCENTGCIYKQLQRAKAENYELKESLKVYERPDIKKVLTYYRTGELERLEQENEELKQDLHEVENACSCFESENADLRKENERLKQALQEIREIVETCLKFHKCEKCKFYKECQYDLEEYIIAKINEVIGAEE